MRKENHYDRNRLSALDVVLFVILTLLGLAIILPFYNAIMISFVTEAEYFRSPFILFPKDPTLEAYRTLLETGSILNGYGNTLYHIAVGLPISMFITFAMGYVLSRPEFPGRKLLYPVSYTHLDVYKRQIPWDASSEWRCTTASNRWKRWAQRCATA